MRMKEADTMSNAKMSQRKLVGAKVREAKSFVRDLVLNMDTKSRVTQAVRLISSFLSILLIIVLLVGAHNNPKSIYVVRLDTSKIDVSKGLFSAMRKSFSHNELLDDQFGAGLTSSEILILSQYAEKQVENAPDYITSSLYSWCRTSYSYKIQGNYLTGDSYSLKISNRTTYCSHPVNSYFFDYRSLLSQSHFEIILEYAYGDTGGNEKYIEYLKKRENMAYAGPKLLIFTAVSQLALIGLLLAYYSFKNDGTDISKLIGHISSGLSLASFITCAIACISTTVIYLQFKSSIRQELSPYGFTLKLGTTFFGLLWVIFSLVLLSMTSWGGPTWCAPPALEYDEDVESQMEMFLQNTRDEDETEAATAKPSKTSTKRFKFGKDKVTTAEVEESDETTPSPSNFLTNEEEILLKSNDKIFRSGTFRY